MALINCPECGAEISDRAPACPRCGCPMQMVSAPASAPVAPSPAPSQSTAANQCDVCGQTMVSGRQLYLHRVNVHSSYDTNVTSPTGTAPRAPQSARIECPHCHVKGRVLTRRVKAKKGISGGKATGALLTGGLSILATGLSRREWVTECRCGSCGVSWVV
jgi:hypothetical protein